MDYSIFIYNRLLILCLKNVIVFCAHCMFRLIFCILFGVYAYFRDMFSSTSWVNGITCVCNMTAPADVICMIDHLLALLTCVPRDSFARTRAYFLVFLLSGYGQFMLSTSFSPLHGCWLLHYDLLFPLFLNYSFFGISF